MTEWITVGSVADLQRSRNKMVVEVDDVEIFVFTHGGELYAFQNRCIHKERELSKGVVLNGKLVCPGHQWAFALDTGWEAIKESCQPTFPIRQVDGRLEICTPAPLQNPSSDRF